MNTSPEIESRVESLLARMTLAEKIGQTVQVFVEEGNRAQMVERIRTGGVGSVLNIHGVRNINALQKVAVEESRLGIPLLVGTDVIHGYRTIFPIPLAESCAWDPELAAETARIAAEEATANALFWTFAPMVDITRDPRWGRIAEGAGEDPYLGSVLAAARVRGFQSELSNGHRMTACPKHLAAYGWAEAGKDYNTADLSERTLRDVVLPPFKAAVEAGAGTMMSAFNEINGVPATACPLTLRKILREEWNFQGVVVSDWASIEELLVHGVAEDLREAARRAFLAGTDMDMTADAYHRHLADLIEAGEIPERLLDESVRRILRLKFQLGLFEKPYADPEAAEAAILKPEYLQTAHTAAVKSMVLLKNQGDLLPIDPAKIRRIALIGPLADDHHEILGSWYGIGRDEDSISILEALRAALPEGVELTYTQGCDIDGQRPTNTISAVTAAQKADLVIMALGEAESMSGEAHSRAHLGLPGKQQFLLEAVHATGTPVVVVLVTGRPLVIPWMAENIPAILCAWQGGVRTGTAVADILLGVENPSGKLTASWPRAEGQIPVYYAHKNTGRPPEGRGGFQFDQYFHSHFLDEDHTPLFPFGFGLSYTRFDYSDLQVLTPKVGLDAALKVSVKITNRGERPGEEIAQLYVRDLVGEVTRPVKELKNFRKVALQPGERVTVTFEVPVQSLGFHGLDLRYKVEPGKFKVWVGPSSAEGLEGEFEVV